MAGVPTGREETVACTNQKMFDTQHQQGPGNMTAGEHQATSLMLDKLVPG